MPKIKKIEKNALREVKMLFFAMEPVSKRLLLAGYMAVTLTYFCALAVLTFYSAAFPDYTTACYWGGELLQLAKELTGAIFVPVLLFELVLIVCGKKRMR